MHANRSTRRAAVLVLLVALLLVALPAVASADGTAEASFVAAVNAERSARGLAPLDVDGQLTDVARRWTAQMIAVGTLSHRPDLRAAIGAEPELVGENVGRSHVTGASRGELVDRLHRAFMDSPGHRANVLRDWTHVGVGVGLAHGGEEMWVTVNFKRLRPAPTEAVPDATVETATAAPGGSDAPTAAGEAAAAAPAGTAGAVTEAPATAPAGPGADAAADRPDVHTAFATLSPGIRAHFALEDPPLLPRHFAGYLAAV